jgi:uncharacterized protein (TIGR00251 family)
MVTINERDGAVTFEIRVQPRASRTALAGEHAGAIRLSVAAPPVDGKANEECRRFLAELLRVPRGAVEILKGASSRTKIIRVQGIGADRLRLAVLEGAGPEQAGSLRSQGQRGT